MVLVRIQRKRILLSFIFSSHRSRIPGVSCHVIESARINKSWVEKSKIEQLEPKIILQTAFRIVSNYLAIAFKYSNVVVLKPNYFNDTLFVQLSVK